MSKLGFRSGTAAPTRYPTLDDFDRGRHGLLATLLLGGGLALALAGCGDRQVNPEIQPPPATDGGTPDGYEVPLPPNMGGARYPEARLDAGTHRRDAKRVRPDAGTDSDPNP